GRDGELQLGATVLDRANLADHATGLLRWQSALTGDADILIYGCDLAQTDDGRAFVDDLALLTGADVSASSDATGSQNEGGNWVLEYARGEVTARSLVQAEGAMQWQGLLALNAVGSETIVNTNTSGAQSTTNGGQVAMNASGRHVVVWSDAGTIKAAVFSADGTKVVSDFTVA